MVNPSTFLLNDKMLPPIEKRRRIKNKDCRINGDPYKDVDEGIAEEVRIFNDVLGLKTYSSCEGHLVNDSYEALIVSYINNREQLKKIKTVIKKEDMFPILPLKISNVSTNSIGTDFILPRASEKTNYCKKYFDSYLLFRALVRKIKGYIGSFTVKVIPYDTTIDQTKWDRIRRRRFIDVINMLYDVNLRKK